MRFYGKQLHPHRMDLYYGGKHIEPPQWTKERVLQRASWKIKPASMYATERDLNNLRTSYAPASVHPGESSNLLKVFLAKEELGFAKKWKFLASAAAKHIINSKHVIWSADRARLCPSLRNYTMSTPSSRPYNFGLFRLLANLCSITLQVQFYTKPGPLIAPCFKV